MRPAQRVSQDLNSPPATLESGQAAEQIPGGRNRGTRKFGRRFQNDSAERIVAEAERNAVDFRSRADGLPVAPRFLDPLRAPVEFDRR